MTHLDLDWDEGNPRKAFIERVATFARLIRFDKRGTGLSDRPSAVATLEERTDDIRAVMDAAASERAFLFGLSEGANMACLFAATNPHRTRGLVVWGGQARWVATEDYPWGLTRAEAEAVIAILRERRVSEEYLTGPGAGFPADRIRELQWMLRYMRAGASPSAVAAPARAIRCALSIRDELRELGIRIRAGVHTGECELTEGHVRGIAIHIGARVMSLAEPDEVLVSSTVGPGCREWDRFPESRRARSQGRSGRVARVCCDWLSPLTTGKSSVQTRRDGVRGAGANR